MVESRSMRGHWRVAGVTISELPTKPVPAARGSPGVSAGGHGECPPEAAQERPQGGWRLDYAAERASRPAGAQHVGVVNAVAASQRGGHQGHDLSAGVGSAWCIAQVQAPVNQFGKAQVQGQRSRARQPWPAGSAQHC